MEDTHSVVDESNGTDRRIDSERLTRALTEDLSIAVIAPAQYAVTHDDRRYDVDVHAATCECPDATYREVACKHLVAAAAFHTYLDERNSRFVARVVAALGEYGCAHEVRGCAGPVALGERTIPCEGCMRVTPGHWTVWNRLVNHETVTPDDLPTAEPALVIKVGESDTDADAETGEPAIATDGGTVTDTHDTDEFDTARGTYHGREQAVWTIHRSEEWVAQRRPLGHSQWSLRVYQDGVIAMSRTVPYSGTRTYSTADRENRSDKTSEYRLALDEVLGRYHTKLNDRFGSAPTVRDLRERVDRVLRRDDVDGEPSTIIDSEGDRVPRKTEPADFGGGGSTGVEEL